MLHIVYSNNINLNKLRFVNAFSDALDVDVSSDIYISNSEFINPSNDSIDFMESKAKVENSTIIGSGDKGVSIGENSNIELLNLSLKKNNIGIAVKDSSVANISTSKLVCSLINLPSSMEASRPRMTRFTPIFSQSFADSIFRHDA